jgi:hypothetical protein
MALDRLQAGFPNREMRSHARLLSILRLFVGAACLLAGGVDAASARRKDGWLASSGIPQGAC